MISAIIVTYNSREHIGRCLAGLTGTGAEAIVVDNASTDGTAEFVRTQFPAVKLISGDRNLGFAAAANLGVRQSAGRALLFLNADVICDARLASLEDLLSRDANLAAIAPRLVDAGGRTQIGFTVRRLPSASALIFEILLLNRIFPRNPVNRRYRCLDLDYEQPQRVEQPAGACLMVRRDVFESCGGFDEKFFPLWFEDVDLCLRIGRRGGILYWPLVAFEHSGGHSVETLSFSDRQVYWYRNLLYYVTKHFPWTTGIAIRTVLLCGIALRVFAELPGFVAAPRSRASTRSERVCAYLKAARLSFLGWR